MSAPAGYSQVSAQTPEQGNFLQQLLSMLSGQGAEGFQQAIQQLMQMAQGSPESFEAFEAPAIRQFEEQIIPGLQERITAQGGGGGRSGAQARLLGGAGEKFAEGLASQRAGLQQNAIQQLLSTYLQGGNLGLGTQAFGFQQDPKSMLGRFGQAAGGAATGALAGAPFGPAGSAVGAIGGGIKSYFA